MNVQVNPSNAPIVVIILLAFVCKEFGWIDERPDISDFIPHVVLLIGILIVTRRRFDGAPIRLVFIIVAYILRMLNLNLEISYEYEYEVEYEDKHDISAPQVDKLMNLTLQRMF